MNIFYEFNLDHLSTTFFFKSISFSKKLDFKERPQPAGIYLFNLNNSKAQKISEMCSKLTKKTPNDVINVVQVSLLLTLNRFRTLFLCFHCWLWASNKLTFGRRLAPFPFSKQLNDHIKHYIKIHWVIKTG